MIISLVHPEIWFHSVLQARYDKFIDYTCTTLLDCLFMGEKEAKEQ